MAWCWDGALFQGFVDGQKGHRNMARMVWDYWENALADSLMYGRFLRGAKVSKGDPKV